MDLKTVAIYCALLVTLTLVSDGLARPESPDVTSTFSASNVQQIQETLEEILPLYRAVTKSAHKEHGHGHGKLPIVHLILIIGKVLAPLVGAIVEPLLVNIAKGITWAITYSLATGFDKPQSYDHFIPALEHHTIGGGGGGGGNGGEDDVHDHYEAHKPDDYSLKELPGLAMQLTSTVLSESDGTGSGNADAVENAGRKLVNLLLPNKSTLTR